MIEVENLRKSFGAGAKTVHAVNCVNFSARDGQITGLLGPNGAGKTTTMRMLYTLMTPDSGRVLVDGVDIAKDPQRVRESLGVLPDARGLYKRLSARENIQYFADLQGMSREKSAQSISRLIERLQLADIIDRRTEGFSNGQRVKTGLARALVHNPKNVILDEPTNGLDVMSTRALRQSIKSLRDDGHCVLFSSHIMQEVAALCDRIVVIAKGQVVAEGTADQLRELGKSQNLEDAFVNIIGTDEGLML
jgi:sodium transport system ATP-binding protein